MAETEEREAAAPPKQEKYVVWLGARGSPVTTEVELRSVLSCIAPLEFHSKNFNEGGYCLITVKDVRQAWIIYEYSKLHGLNVGKERGPIFDRVGRKASRKRKATAGKKTKRTQKPSGFSLSSGL